MDGANMIPMEQLEEGAPFTTEERDYYYALVGECLENETLTENQAATLIFGPDDF